MQKSGHIPDRQKLAKHIKNWLNMRDDVRDGEWENLSQILAAVPVEDKWQGWRYDYYVLTIDCDEHYFSLLSNGEPTDLSLDEVDFYIPLE